MKVFGNVVMLNHALLAQVVKPGMTVLDATCGNGNDSVMLASLLKEDGLLTVMDIQAEAIQTTAEKLSKMGYGSGLTIRFIEDSHSHISQYFSDASIDVGLYNLGYLPGGDKTVTTETTSTLKAVQQTLKCLKPSGILVVVAYPGHTEGKNEKDALSVFFKELPQKQYDVAYTSFINQKGQPPVMWLVEKK
jgi:ubiquinone/menaquinone biosynthesis C-methylase UbiE